MRTYCNCPIQRSMKIADVNEYVKREGAQSLLRWNKARLTPARALMEQIPFRPRECTTEKAACCGNCTASCQWRCVQDCLHRSYMYLALLKDVPTEKLRPEMIALREAFSATPARIEYEPLVKLIQKIIRVDKEVSKGHKFNYAPLELDEVDPRTGFKYLQEWPASGLCPFCRPIQRQYVRKPSKPRRG